MELKCERTQYGHTRTTCDCKMCSIWCRFVPGYMVPDDVMPMYAASKLKDESLQAWAKRCLLASPGAKVGIKRQVGHRIELHVVQVPTLVPARKDDGSCTFLTAEGKCGIHAVSPFGCAFVDSHMPHERADEISTDGLRDLMERLKRFFDHDYYRLWQILADDGHMAPSAEDGRRRLQEELKKEPV